MINVTWVSDKKVNGFVPSILNSQANQIVSVVLVTYYNVNSDPWKMKFEGGHDLPPLQEAK